MIMWIDDVPKDKGWSSLWHNLYLCSCGGIRVRGHCSACGKPEVPLEPMEFVFESGERRYIPSVTTGAEGRYEDWLYLDLLQREWERLPSTTADGLLRHEHISHHATVVLLFWAYFESRIERLLRLGLRGVPEPLREDVLSRYSAIGARIDRLYRLVFGTTYYEDLNAIGAAQLVPLLLEVQKRRNEFAHGTPGAITDDLVERLVSALLDEHFAWIAVFNRRVTAQRVQQPSGTDAEAGV